MGGNDKLTPFVKTDKKRKTKTQAFSANPRNKLNRQFDIYGISRAGLHLSESGKTQRV
jgi:hypothetical protein